MKEQGLDWETFSERVEKEENEEKERKERKHLSQSKYQLWLMADVRKAQTSSLLVHLATRTTYLNLNSTSLHVCRYPSKRSTRLVHLSSLQPISPPHLTEMTLVAHFRVVALSSAVPLSTMTSLETNYKLIL
jgi:hypothetical protein